MKNVEWRLLQHWKSALTRNSLIRSFCVIHVFHILFFFLYIFAEALRLHGSMLTEYERQEIEKYPEIWFLGLDACKINAKAGTSLNSGYDDDNGSYNKVKIELFSHLVATTANQCNKNKHFILLLYVFLGDPWPYFVSLRNSWSHWQRQFWSSSQSIGS